MLRFIFWKLTGFTSKQEFPLSSSCNHMFKLRPSTSLKREYRREARRTDQVKPQQRRSYSFPTRSTKSCHLLEKQPASQSVNRYNTQKRQGLELVQKQSFHQSRKRASKSVSLATGSEAGLPPSSKYEEPSCFEQSEVYELESAAPKRSQSELVFNVFDSVTKDVDLSDYLQPNNLKPFGSHENIYLPMLMTRRNFDNTSNETDYLQSISDLPIPLPSERNGRASGEKKHERISKSTVRVGDVNKEIMRKHKELAPYVSKVLSPKVEKKQIHSATEITRQPNNKPSIAKSFTSQSLDRAFTIANDYVKNFEHCRSCRSSLSKMPIKIEPPPFFKRDETPPPPFSLNVTKRNLNTDYGSSHPPWPAYSDCVKRQDRKGLIAYPPGYLQEEVNNSNVNTQVNTPLDSIGSNMEQQSRSLSTERVATSVKSSIYQSKPINANAVAQSSLALLSKPVTVSLRQNYANSSRMIRQLEPKPCKPPEKKRKCFLPSKVRLKPPKCTPKPDYDCKKEPPCPPRADDCLVERKKTLPCLDDTDCKCVEPPVPSQNPKLRRLLMKFEDEPRICPCVPVECPCPPPERADDCVPQKLRKLQPYVPQECSCVEPPRMVDVPLIRLQKVCEPPHVCRPPPRVCPPPEPCVRADDCLEDRPKTLPPLNIGDCRCVDTTIPKLNPKMRRLKMQFVDPPRVCPCEPLCECPEAPERADWCVEEKVKKLPVLKAKECECIEPPPMVDVPLKRLQKVCIPPDVCREPKKECPVELCEDKFRADMCLVEHPKTLPKLDIGDCECHEKHVPDKNPALKRLRMKFKDEPRICPCVPEPCPCPPPERADDCVPQKVKKLYPYVPQECSCVEPPRMVDVPLIRLQKVCEPEEKCYPKAPCVEEKCEDRDRADDCLVERRKALRPIKPQPCPCIEPKLKDVPKLKRLLLSVPEPPRVCPPEKVCPPLEPYSRADECLPDKVKKLRPLKAGDCPCVDRPMVDVNFGRLKCRDDPEECLPCDPCCDFPRADWGCWEYLEDAEPEKHDKSKNKKDKSVGYKQKRKLSTDTKTRAFVDNSKSQIFKSGLNRKPLGTEFSRTHATDKNASMTKCLSSVTSTSVCAKYDKAKLIKAGTLPGNKVVSNQAKPVKESAVGAIAPTRNSSLPTLLLLQELCDDTLPKDKIADLILQKPDTKSVLTKIPDPAGKALKANNVRNLSTTAVGAKRPSNKGAVRDLSDSFKDEDSPLRKHDAKMKRKPCKRISKCGEPMILKNCPQKEERTCLREKQLVCCEKKQSPNPAFSECMDEEIKPYSNTAQWKCDRKEYGFEVKPGKEFEPLDTAKGKKKFSTFAKQQQNEENSVVNYFCSRYGRNPVQGQSRKCSSDACNTTIVAREGGRNVVARPSAVLSTSVNDVLEFATGTRGCASVKDKSVDLSKQSKTTRIPSRENRSGLLSSRCNLNRDVSNKSFSVSTKSPVPTVEFVTINRTSRRQLSDDKSKKDDCKKKSCVRFEMDNCPEQNYRPTCRIEPNLVCKKAEAPYPSFSELMDDEMEDKLTECPIEKEKVQHLQPRYPIPFEKPKILDPVPPEQGRIDPKVEEVCIRERLCLENTGLTQDCNTFGDYIKPMKSKNYIKERNTECEKMEELKKLGKWPPKDYKKFSTSAKVSAGAQKRGFCSSANTAAKEKRDNDYLFEDISDSTPVRNYHVLCKNRQGEGVEKEHQIAELDEPCKYTKLRNVQWRIDNFQKWHRLKKMSTAKKYHTCSKLKFSKFIRYNKLQSRKNNFSVSASKAPTGNQDVWAHRAISTTMLLKKNKTKESVRFPLYPKPIKQHPKIKIPNAPKPMKPVTDPKSPGKNKRNKTAKAQEKLNVRLQPRYASVPEASIPEPEQYTLHVTSLGNEEGNSYDCSAVEKPFIHLNSSRASTVKFNVNEEMVTCTPCGEIFLRSNRNYGRGSGTEKDIKEKRCPKFPKPHPCELPLSVRRLKEAMRSSCPCPSQAPSVKPPCKPAVSPSTLQVPALLNLWERVVNYFKARPDCPPPDEWRKKALREKAEKAAKAAGLVLCDPKDLPQNVSSKEVEEEEEEVVPKKCVSKVSNRLQCPPPVAKSDNSRNCFPARKNPCKTTRRHYSNGVNFDDFEELMEKEKKANKIFMEKFGMGRSSESRSSDEEVRVPDPVLEQLFNEAILEKNSLRCLENPVEPEGGDGSLNYSLRIVPSGVQVLQGGCLDDTSNETYSNCTGDDNKALLDFQEFFSKVDTLSPDVIYEELEKVKTKNLVKQLDDLLKENQEFDKEN